MSLQEEEEEEEEEQQQEMLYLTSHNTYISMLNYNFK